MSDGPKLYTHKPKKAHLKQSQKHQQASSPKPPASATMSSSTPPGTSGAPPPPPPPPQPPKESFARRYKFMWPLLLAVNFTVGAYLFTRTKKSDVVDKGEVPSVPSTSVPTTAVAATVTEKPSIPTPVIEPPKPRDPIPDDQQKELFRWILEEKRKVKPKDPEERKRIDEEKALLKQFIRAKSIPSL